VPLIAWLILTYLCGLLAGLSGIATPMAILAVAAAGIAIIVGSARQLILCVVAIAGMIAGSATTESVHRCVEASVRSASISVEILSDVEPGGFTRGTIRPCGAPASIWIAKGHANAGATVAVTGQSSAAPDGGSVVVLSASIRETMPPSWAARLRSTAERQTDSAFADDAPLVRALVLADMQQMSPEIRDRWAAAGLAHMLSVSGLHVGIIAAVVELLLGVMRVNRRFAPIVGVVIIAVYVVVVGAPPAAVRSAVMLAARGFCRMLQRSVSPWAFLALGAAQPLIDPAVVTDLGYQLSVIGVAALIVAGALVKRLPIAKRPRWRRDLLTGLVCTVVASLASAPLVAWSFGRVSLVAPLSNLLAGPVIAAVQPILFLGVLLGPFHTAARFVADAAHPLLVLLDVIASRAADVPGASITVWPSTMAAAAAGAVTLCVLVACVHERPERPLLIGTAMTALLVWLPAPRGADWTELHMIDVGQGDAIALRTRAGHWVLIDAGRIWPGGDAGRRTVVPYIAHRGGSLSAFVLTHPHADHVGGAASTIDALRPSSYYDAAFVAPSGPYAQSLQAAKRDRVRWGRVHPGDSLVVDEATIHFLAPDSVFEASLPDPNNASTVALVRVGNVRFLLMGDAERPEEEWLLANEKASLAADVLKVGHHGSSTSSSGPFLDAVHPRIALVSVGVKNSYGHPSATVMADLARRGVQVLRTDRLGTVVLATDGRSLVVRGR
jgi:competence protein ComEC